MKKLVILLAFVITSVSASAQWKRLGWEGGGVQFYQRDDIFYGITGAYVYRSTDDCETWTEISDGLPISTHSRVQFFGFDGDDFTVRDNETSYWLPFRYPYGTYVYRKSSQKWEFYDDSLNGGMYGPSSLRVGKDTAFRINPAVGGSGYDTSRIYYTSDQGVTWHDRSPSPPGSSYADVEQVAYYKGSVFARVVHLDSTAWSRNIYMSKDIGLTWTKLPLQASYFYPDFYYPYSQFAIFAVCFPPSPDTVDYDGLFRSTDSGTTWHKIEGLVPDHYWNVLFIKDIDGKIFAGFDYYSNEVRIFPVFSSADSGKTWQREHVTADSTQRLWGVYKRAASNDGFLVGLQSTPIIKVDNNYQPNGPAPAFGGIINESALLLSAYNGQLIAKKVYVADSVYLSNDGLTWTSRPWVQGQSLESTPWLQGDRYVYTLMRDSLQVGKFYRSSDNGITWDSILSADGSQVLDYSNIGDTLFVTLQGMEFRHMYASFEAGDSWHVQRSPDPSEPVSIVGYQNEVLYAENIGKPHSSYYQSTNWGDTWKEFQFPFGKDTLVEHLFFDRNTIIASTSTEVEYAKNKTYKVYSSYASTNNGLTWHRYGETLPANTPIVKLVRQGTTLYLLSYAASVGNAKVFYSRDDGITWKQMPGVVPEAQHLFVDGSRIFLTSLHKWALYGQTLEPATIGQTHPDHTALSIVPNPASESCTVIVGSSTQTRSVKIIDLLGRVRQEYSLLPQEERITLQTSHLPSGAYYVRVISGTSTSTTLLQVQ